VLRIQNTIAFLLGLVALAACSDDSPRKNYSTKGLVAPSVACNANPERLGDATKIRDIDLGNGCFVHDAYRVTSLQGVQFNQPSTFSCSVASRTSYWLAKVVQPAAEESFGERVVKIDVPSAFACRPRNNVRGAKLSEHGMGNAIDVAAFTLESGRKVEVEQGWFGDRDAKSFLRTVRSEACGPFHTVLGPGSDAHHKDHIHMDLQTHRSGGTYCH
jgi:hypothetical protein